MSIASMVRVAVIGGFVGLLPFALREPAAFMYQQRNEDCACKNVNANSSPSDPTDVCTRTETPAICNLRWNATSPPPARGKAIRPPSDPAFHKAFSGVVGGGPGRGGGWPTPPEGIAQCAGSPDPACPWVEFLRLESYRDDPPSAAIGFIALASAGFSSSGDSKAGAALTTELQEPAQRLELGQAIAGGKPVDRSRELYKLHAQGGCLRVQATSSPLVVAIQNRLARSEGACGG